jgi:hypothetical protein
MTLDDLTPLLAASRATDDFRRDVEAFLSRTPVTRIHASANNPRVKVLRAIAQLLHTEPDIEVAQVDVTAVSGCADYVGTLTATDATGAQHSFDFSWNCEWKARQMGYVDWFGLPDQIRAAQEFGWQCFERWTRLAVTEVSEVSAR